MYYYSSPTKVSVILEPELFLFTAAKNYGHKCFITERKQREMGHNTEPLFVNKPPDVSSKPTEKRGLGTRIMVSKGMVSKSKYWISEKIRVYQYPFLQSQYSHFFSYAL